MNRSVKGFPPVLPGITGLLIALAGAGCVPIPVGPLSQPTFPPEMLQRLTHQDADKHLVQRTLGHPVATRAGGRYWFYASARESVGFIGADLVIKKYEWVAIQFNDGNRVIFLERSDDGKGCLSNGICQSAGLFSTQPSIAVITAPRVEDAAARSHQPRADECAVYLYLDKLPWLADARVTFSVGGRTQGVLDDKTYLFLAHPRGEIGITAYQLKMHATCRGGEKLYVKAVKAGGWSLTGKELTLVAATDGEAAIRARRLALPD